MLRRAWQVFTISVAGLAATAFAIGLCGVVIAIMLSKIDPPFDYFSSLNLFELWVYSCVGITLLLLAVVLQAITIKFLPSSWKEHMSYQSRLLVLRWGKTYAVISPPLQSAALKAGTWFKKIDRGLMQLPYYLICMGILLFGAFGLVIFVKEFTSGEWISGLIYFAIALVSAGIFRLRKVLVKKLLFPSKTE